MTNELKSMSARLGHVKRRLARGEPLTGNHLRVALDAIGQGNTGDELIDGIACKLKVDQELNAYELHLMIDVFLLHAKLASVGYPDGRPLSACGRR
ncbi:hypothetical protein [Achromobacter xylosoxidans]|uniref:hypothetical protein n=1 Tax=Alcaligenes xylosoxydans xylosoxydans TaxID=85698 RepID=UPI0012935D78|nr:hypothetical protein [Achromobacter xylosoxidans]